MANKQHLATGSKKVSKAEEAHNIIYLGTMYRNFQMSISRILDINEVGNAH